MPVVWALRMLAPVFPSGVTESQRGAGMLAPPFPSGVRQSQRGHGGPNEIGAGQSPVTGCLNPPEAKKRSWLCLLPAHADSNDMDDSRPCSKLTGLKLGIDLQKVSRLHVTCNQLDPAE